MQCQIDEQGRLFGEEARVRNRFTSLKDERFLNFFFRNLRDNDTEQHNDYPFVSPCGKELNYVKVRGKMGACRQLMSFTG